MKLRLLSFALITAVVLSFGNVGCGSGDQSAIIQNPTNTPIPSQTQNSAEQTQPQDNQEQPALPPTSAESFTPSELPVDAVVIAEDGTYLGKITSNKYDSDSICNKYGDYGSAYSDKSMFNKYGDYGSSYSNKSPNNSFATNPPIIVINGESRGYITTNTFKTPGATLIELTDYLGCTR